MRPFENLSRLFIALTVAAIAAPPPALGDEEVGTKKIDVAPQPLSSALQEFSEQFGLQVAYVATLAENVNSGACAQQRNEGSEGLPATAAGADIAQKDAAAAVNALADEHLEHLRATNAYVRLLNKLPIVELDDVTSERAVREAAYARQMLQRLNALPSKNLPHEQWLLSRMLRHTFASAARSDEDYWLQFAVTPYAGGRRVMDADRILAAQTLDTAQAADNYLHLLDEYAAMLEQMAAKTIAQAQRGIRVPKPAIPGVVATFQKLKAGAGDALMLSAQRLQSLPAEHGAPFRDAVAKRIADRVAPAYDRIVAVFDASYESKAPAAVGLSQFPKGKDYYRRLITYRTGLELTPQQIHDRGLAHVGELEREMQQLRDRIGFKGTRAQFHERLRTDPRFLAKTPAEVEQRYMQHLARIEPRIPQYFSTLPQARYGVKRLEPAAELGQTYGGYQVPTPAEPIGYYRYNGSNLDKRSLVTAAHLIYHELVPGHHFQIGLQTERARRKEIHPLREFLFYDAFKDGWAEYAASLAREMGALEDPYDRYGHLVMQSFLASRLVVDTGMNYFGWPLEKAREYMKAHTFESDVQIASESLRYSTDIFAQALVYRLGYDKFWELRSRAQEALGKGFDVRAFHAAVVGQGAMPLDVLDEHIDRFIRAEQKRVAHVH